MDKNTSHYDTLGVPADATDDQIKQAYRSASKKHHPDKGGDEQEFKKATNAYMVLSDPAKRAEYDRTGEYPKPNSDLQLVMEFISMTIEDFRNRQDIKYGNLQHFMHHMLTDREKKVENAKAEADKRIRQYEEMLSRSKGPEDGPVHGVLKSMIEQTKEAIPRMDADLDKVKMIREHLAEYEYTPEEGHPLVFDRRGFAEMGWKTVYSASGRSLSDILGSYEDLREK